MATSLDPINTTPPVAPGGRPIFITVLCVLGVIGSLLALPVVFSDVYNTLGLPGWYKGYIIVSVLATLAAIYGMWTMQKWGAYLYIALGILGIIISVVTNTFSVGFSLILQIAIMAGAFYYSRMMR